MRFMEFRGAVSQGAGSKRVYQFRYADRGQHAGSLIREARAAAGLTQQALAERAGTSQPAVARYERGAALPTLTTLERLLRACGHSLLITARDTLGPRARGLQPRRVPLLDAARRHGVSGVRVFGSTARGEDHPASDIDLLVDLEPGRTLLDLAAFRREAGEILGAPVDVATPDMLKERIRGEVLTEAVPL